MGLRARVAALEQRFVEMDQLACLHDFKLLSEQKPGWVWRYIATKCGPCFSSGRERWGYGWAKYKCVHCGKVETTSYGREPVPGSKAVVNIDGTLTTLSRPRDKVADATGKA